MPPSPDLIDVSRPLAADTACWPGDVPFSFRLVWTHRRRGERQRRVDQDERPHGHPLRRPVPLRQRRGHGRSPAAGRVRRPGLGGRCPRRLAVARPAGQARDFADTPRVLFHTGGWPDTARFPESIPVMEPELPDWLADRGVRLIGVDLPSVDPLDSKTLDNHHALGRRGVTIVEGLWLADVPRGRYELIALPLKIVGADGSPVRAVLRRV